MVGVAVLSAQSAPVRGPARAVPRAARAAERRRRATPVARRWTASPARLASRGWPCAPGGDAGGYVDALTGEGISLGLAQARAAVRRPRGRPPRGLRAGLEPRQLAVRSAHARPRPGHSAGVGAASHRPGGKGAACGVPGLRSTSWGGPRERARPPVAGACRAARRRGARDRHGTQERGAPRSHAAAPRVLGLPFLPCAAELAR